MSKKTDLDKSIETVKTMIADKRREIIAMHKELRRTEGELSGLVALAADLVKVDKAVGRALKIGKDAQKELTEALLSSMVPPDSLSR